MALTSLNLNNLPSVCIDFMNRTHQEEIEIMESLARSILSWESGAQNEKEISKQLTNWLEHSQAHFSRENELMQETKFPAFSIHSREHETVLNQMQIVVNNWLENEDFEQLRDYVFSQWPTWFVDHVNTMDKVTAKHAVMNGYVEEIT